MSHVGRSVLAVTTTPPRLHTRPRWLLGPWHSADRDVLSTHLVMQTVQKVDVWDALARHGRYGPPRWDDDHDFAGAYGWMHQQMADQLSTRSPGIVWLWAQHPGRGFLRMQAESGDVLLTCRIRREDVVISDFGDWHCVLNRTPLVASVPGEDGDAYGRRLDPILDDFFDRREAAGMGSAPLVDWPDQLRREVETTWTGIFDAEQWSNRSVLQATVPELRAEQVVRAVRVR